MSMQWTFKRFDALTPYELYDILHLRTEVFVIEQNCPFQDMDGADNQAMHLMGRGEGGKLIAYSRIFDKAIKFAEASIGRVMTHQSARLTGLGHVLMKESIAKLCEAYGTQPIRIGAQARLEKFYQGHGFVTASEPYIEDGIPHIEMLWLPQPKEKQ